MVDVSLAKCGSYEEKEVDMAVARLISSIGGIEKFVPAKKKVLIKPNVVKAADPQTSIVTHPLVIGSIIKILKKQDCEIMVGDNPFTDNSYEALKVSGIYGVCKKHNVKISNFEKKIDVSFDKGLVVDKFTLAKDYDWADLIINAPKLKTHFQLYATGAVKNLYGLMSLQKRAYYHFKYSDMEHFANMLLDLYLFLKPKIALNVFDGVFGMEGEGPTKGVSKFVGILGASEDALALDHVMFKLSGLNLNLVSTLQYGKRRKDINFDPHNISFVGEDPARIHIEKFTEPDLKNISLCPNAVEGVFQKIFKKKKIAY